MLRKLIFAILLSSFVCAFAQIEELPVRVINGTAYYCYDVPPKATIYSITRTYGITREELFKYNPQVIDGLRAGDTLIFPVKQEIEPIVEAEPEEEPEIEQEVEQAVEAEEVTPEPEVKPAVEPEVKPQAEPEPEVTIEPLQLGEDAESINVGVMLPFMLDSEAQTRQIQNQTAFYRGMLLAVEQLADENNGIQLYAYDTESSPAVLETILSRPESATLDYIIAPGDSLSIEMIANMADTTRATVINLFAVKNDAHLRHESVLQANIPHDAMYTHAGRAYCELLKGKKALILNATDIPADKREFTDELEASLLRAGIPYETIDYSGKLTMNELSSLPERDYVCIPTSSTREALMKVLPALGELADANPLITISLLGYPEWVVIRGEVKDKLHKFNATVYSRFSTDLDGSDVSAVNTAYNKWYGEEPQQSLPDVMLLGYDTVAWLLRGIDRPYTGLQNSFRITELDDAGSVNEGMYLINFTRSGRVDAVAL